MNILVLTSVLPSPIKPFLNDILLISAARHKMLERNVKYRFVLIIPFSPWILGLLSKKWRRYYALRKKGFYELEGEVIDVLAIPMYKTHLWLNIWGARLGYILNRKKLNSMIVEFNPDIIHSHNVLVDTIITEKLSRKFALPFVVTDRSIYKYNKSALVRNNLLKSAKVISVNNTYYKISRNIVGESKSALIPHGIDDSFFSFNKKQSKSDCIRIVSICGLWPLKNIDKVILALDKIDRKFIYDIFGEGPDHSRLMNILAGTKIHENVRFKGRIPHQNVGATLSEYDIFVMPSYPENFGRAFVEAMAVGLPIIGAKNAGIDGYIRNGVDGFVIDHNDGSELYEILNLLMKNNDLIARVGGEAKVTAAKFSWPVIVERIHNIYSQSINHNIK